MNLRNSLSCAINVRRKAEKKIQESRTVPAPHRLACSMPMISTTRSTSGMPRALKALARASVALYMISARSESLKRPVLSRCNSLPSALKKIVDYGSHRVLHPTHPWNCHFRTSGSGRNFFETVFKKMSGVIFIERVIGKMVLSQKC